VDNSMVVKPGRQRARAAGWACRAGSSPEAALAARDASALQPVASSASSGFRV